MLDREMLGRATRRSTGFLLRSLVVSVILYLGITVVVMVADLVSLLTGWYPFAIESGTLELLGYTLVIDNSTNFYFSFELSLVGFFVLLVAVGLLTRLGSAVRSLRSTW